MFRWIKRLFAGGPAAQAAFQPEAPETDKNVDGADFLLFWIGALQHSGDSPLKPVTIETMQMWLLVYSAADHLCNRVSDVETEKLAASAASAVFPDDPAEIATAVERMGNNWSRLQNLHPQAVERYVDTLRAMFDDETAGAVFQTAAMMARSNEDFQDLMTMVPKTATRPVLDALSDLCREADETGFAWV